MKYAELLELSDEVLFAEHQRGNDRTFAILYDRHNKRLCGKLYKNFRAFRSKALST
jgi:hypothetical protein